MFKSVIKNLISLLEFKLEEIIFFKKNQNLCKVIQMLFSASHLQQVWNLKEKQLKKGAGMTLKKEKEKPFDEKHKKEKEDSLLKD